MKIAEYLQSKEYPGRGIMVGKTATDIVMAYFIMGRSVNSQNRIFEETEDGIRTKAFDESKMVDPSLIIYHPVRKVGDVTVVTNGDQTDTIRDLWLKVTALKTLSEQENLNQTVQTGHQEFLQL